MRKVAFYGMSIVVLTTAANVLHAISHAGQHVLILPAWQMAYVILVIFAAPVLAAALLWTRHRRTGAWLLLASMAGSFVFGLVFHFLAPGSDNIFTQHPGAWLATFRASAVLTVILAGIGAVVGAWAVKRHSPGGAAAPASSSESRMEPR